MFSPDIIKLFNQKKVRYVVVGGLAVNLHGYIRHTHDLDIVVAMTDNNLRKAISILQNAGFQTTIPENPIHLADPKKRKIWINAQGMKALHLTRDNGRDVIDIVIASPVPYEKMKTHKVVIRGIRYPIASKKDLIKMKEDTGREKDRIDVQQLQALQDIDDAKEGVTQA